MILLSIELTRLDLKRGTLIRDCLPYYQFLLVAYLSYSRLRLHSVSVEAWDGFNVVPKEKRM